MGIPGHDTPEISDVIVSFDPDTLVRRPVERDAARAVFADAGDRRAARIVARLPARGACLDPDAVDATLLRAHGELQRLSEEFQQGPRVLSLLEPLIAVIRARNHGSPIQVVDIGCGLGFIIRWLAASGSLGDDVVLLGCDFNRTFVAQATALAAAEHLDCSFVVGNAFALAEPATIYLSTGVLHHFRGATLPTFFEQQDQPGTQAFVHYDIAPTRLTPIGAWVFHQARMREPLARHDGVASARRAYDDATLLAAVRTGAPAFSALLFDATTQRSPWLNVMRPIIGVRTPLVAEFRRALGPLARRLTPDPPRDPDLVARPMPDPTATVAPTVSGDR